MKKQILLSVSILLSCIILGSFYYASQVYKQRSFERLEQERQNKLDNCLDSMWSLYGNNDELYKSKIEICFKEFK